MMTLAAASSYFDRTEVFDAYSGELLFRAQIDPYDDSKRDAMVAYRRVLSVAPDVVIPSHRCIRAFGAVYIVAGEASIDGLDEAHRVKHVLQASDGTFKVGTITQFLDNDPASTVYGFAEWVKDAKQEAESSDLANVFEVIMPLGTNVKPRQVLWRDDIVYITTSVRRLPSDFIGVTAVRLDQVEPLEAGIQSRTYNPATGGYTLGAQDFPYALRVRWQNLFRYDAQLEARYQEGDFTLALPEDTEVDTSSRITFMDVPHRVLAVDVIEGAVAVHVRRS
ncbi:hypothetical protein H4CHR_02976 [Variovorax sp. PBS-H4]|uniref:hypothetical protein n=1 Tax=Variovorax sp. PBS-H4 TaxID=434008 RepID=UPI0013186E77|nr:hypothetical protein [Variovorax sp. PBS-H4]VTU32259.1 hypothetical protein H4CHR_02976 [Variovorax sp. PBS-H4]